MTTLTATARATLHAAGIAPAEWSRRHFTDGRWHGDVCGCPDDRCVGHHHDYPDDCGCLPALIDELHTTRRADAAAAPIWTRYRHAITAGDQAGAAAARQAAKEWVGTYHPTAPSFSLDELVDGRAGITITSRHNDRRWLVWTPEDQP